MAAILLAALSKQSKEGVQHHPDITSCLQFAVLVGLIISWQALTVSSNLLDFMSA